MKKLFCLFIFTLLVSVLALPAFAGRPTEYPIPEVGTELNGFVVTDVTYMESAATDVVKLEHKKTGSVLYWLANDNIDRSYMIAFHTPINDNTGMPHVFEHATLGGSAKYPGANTFFEMTAKTSNTYLNALTGQFYTMYPMASTSEEQLLRFVDYYMSGLTEPLAVSNKYAMMREAYRYELDDPDGDISLQGVVYSEMLGALTQDSWANYNFQRMIWPGSYVTTVSGGDPEYIPDLTLEAIQAFHETYYQPSNATMYLTGDIDLPVFLELLDGEFLSKYEKTELKIEDSGYTPLEPGYYEETFSYPAEIGSSSEYSAIIYYGFPFEDEAYDIEILDYVCAYLNDESSPLQRLKQERLPEVSIGAEVSIDPENKDALVFVAHGIKESDKEIFKAICDDAMGKFLEEGVNEEVLNGMLVRKQFEKLMELDASSIYLNLSLNMAYYWTIFGDRDAWQLAENFEDHLTELVTVEKLNETARKYWSDLDTSVMAITVSVPGLKEENDAALRAKLDDMKSAMTPEEVEALVEETRAYREFVEESNQIIMPDELNALSVETLPEEMSYKAASETNINGVRVITSEIDSPLIRVSIRTDASVIPFEDLFDYIEFTSLLGTLGTAQYTREELPAKKAAVSSGMNIINGAVEDYETRELESYLLTSWFALPETLEDSFALVEEILFHTDFSDYDYIRSDAAQQYAMGQMYLDSNSLTFALMASTSVYSDLGKYRYYINTEAEMEYLNRLSHMTDEEMDELVAKFETIREKLLNQNGVILTVMGSSENIIRAAALGYNLISSFDYTEWEHVDYAAEIEQLPKHTALVTGGNVVYNLAMTDLEAAGYDKTDGGLQVVAKILDDKLLYPELRVKNSAYGGYSLVYNNYLFGYYSYRDPKVAETFDVYQSAGDFLRNLDIDESELAGYITSVYGDLTSPTGPLSAALIGISDQVAGENSYELTMKMIRDIKSFTPEDIQKYADLAGLAGSEASAWSTGGSKTMIEANADLYDYINYKMMSETSEETDEIIGVLDELSAEDIEEMVATMDEEDIRSLVSYVMDFFTDENGNVDYESVFGMIGALVDSDWSDEEISIASESLEEAASEDAAADGSETAVEEGGIEWESIVNYVFTQAFSSTTEEEAASNESTLGTVLEGIFGAFISSLSE